MYFLVDIRYNEFGRLVLLLYDDVTEKILQIPAPNGHTPYLLTDNITRIQNDTRIVRMEEIEKYDPSIFSFRKLHKVCVKNPTDIFDKKTRRGLRTLLDTSWEDDIKYTHCFLNDKGIVVGALYPLNDTPSFKFSKEKKLLLKDAKLKKFFTQYLTYLFSLPIPNVKRVALDIEVANGGTNVKDNNSVLMIGLNSVDENKTILALAQKEGTEKVIDEKDDFNIIYFLDEVEMFRYCFSILSECPFWITFNGDGFDFPKLYFRAKTLGLKDEEIPFSIEEKFEEFSAHPKNAIHIDLYRLFETGVMTYAFPQISRSPSLDELGKNILNEGKLPTPDFSKFSIELAKYCFRDTKITLGITTAFDNVVMNIVFLIARIYNIPMEELTRTYMLYMNEILFQRLHRLVNFLIPNIRVFEKKNNLPVPIGKGPEGKKSKYKGAVIDCKPGVYFPVKDYDFRSLYPGVFASNNLSYETIGCEHEENEECIKNKVPEHNFHVCKKYEGIIGAFLGAVREVRSGFKKLAKTHITGALKICLLSFYGLFGSEKTTLYCLPLASSCTAFARYSILTARKKAEELGLETIYTHTDSIFLHTSDEELCKKLVDEVFRLTGVEMDLDKDYRYVVISSNANLLGVLKTGMPDVVGLTGKKRHICIFLKEIFNQTLNILGAVETEEALKDARTKLIKLVEKSIDKLKARDFKLEDLAFHVYLNLPPEMGSGQPYDVAKQYNLAGIPKKQGDYVHEILTLGAHSAKPLELTRMSEVNIDKYIERMGGILEQIFLPLDITFNEIYSLKYEDISKSLEKSPKDEFADIKFKEDEGLDKWM